MASKRRQRRLAERRLPKLSGEDGRMGQELLIAHRELEVIRTAANTDMPKRKRRRALERKTALLKEALT